MNKKTICIIVISVVLIAVGVTGYMLYNSNTINFLNKSKVEREKEEVKKALQDYMDCIPKEEYEKMYNKLERVSKASNAKQTFVERNQKIYKGIKATNMKIDIKEVAKDTKAKDTYKVTYTTTMKVSAGDVEPFDNTATFIKGKDGKFGLKWDHSIIFPDLEAETRVDVKSTKPVRGRILARDGKTELAVNKEDGKRYYPQGSVFAHIVGTVQKVNAEDLKEHKDEGFYGNDDYIGRSGLENAFEEKLRGKKGLSVSIVDKSGVVVKTLAEVPGKDGEDVVTTLDPNKQKVVYNRLKGDRALSVWLDPKTGDVLAMVSSPSYDPNTGKNEASGAKDTPRMNRCAQKYCPGSSFKTVNSGIGLTEKVYNVNTTYNHDGDTFSKPGWGKYRIKNSHNFSGPYNFWTAIEQSDNIWFGRAALDIGAKRMASNLDKLGFGKEMPFDMKGFQKSSYGGEKALQSEGQLADTGFGQGQLLVNPLHMATIYSGFLNNGNLVKPQVEYKEGREPEYYEKGVFSEDACNIVQEGLKRVVKNGIASKARGGKVGIAGKTGTAELKASLNAKGEQRLWFDGFTYDTDNPVVFVTMKENGSSSNDIAGWTKDMVNGMY